jgi:hypothetical protein
VAKLAPRRSARRSGKTSLNGQQEPVGNSEAPQGADLPDRYAVGWDFLLARGPVDSKLFTAFVEAVYSDSAQLNKKGVVLLTTNGGDANFAYKIGKLLQSRYEDLSICVPAHCKSAGTLITCSANSIIMLPLSELGPLDVQILKRDEIFERRSGLITNYALEELKKHSFELFEHFMLNIKGRGASISFKMASEIAARVTADIMDDVYADINIESLGEDARNLSIASEYSERLNKKFNNLLPTGIEDLVHGYVSHDFVIDADEATTLFRRVEKPTATISRLLTTNAPEIWNSGRSGVVVKFLTNPHANEGDQDARDAGHELEVKAAPADGGAASATPAEVDKGGNGAVRTVNGDGSP